jgi:hypothetical protein
VPDNLLHILPGRGNLLNKSGSIDYHRFLPAVADRQWKRMQLNTIAQKGYSELLRSYMREHVNESITGTMLVVKNGNVLLRTRYGIAILDFIAKHGQTYTVPVHQRMQVYFGDSKGNRFTPKFVQTTGGTKAVTNITSGCDGDPNGYASINTYSIITDCKSGYEISFNTTVSSDDQIVAVNPNNSADISKGSIRIYNPSNTLIYSNLSVSLDPSTNPVIDMGADPTNPGYELFSVTFTSGWISAVTLDPMLLASYTMKLGAFYESDCSDLEHSNGGLWANTYTSAQFPNADPVSRVDVIQTVSSTQPFEFYGEDPVGACTMGYTFPDLQEINYSTNGGGTWIGETSSLTLSYILPPTTAPFQNLTGSSHYGYVDPYGSLELKISLTGSGTMLLRYRNILFNSEPPPGGNYPVPSVGTNCTAGPWSIISSYSY